MTGFDSKTQEKRRRVGDGTPGPGRPKGVGNKVATDVKAMVLEALHHAGGAEYLLMQAYDNPKAFLALVARVLPMQVTGADGGPVLGVVTYRADIPDRTRRAAPGAPTTEVPFRAPFLERIRQ